jgi:hypothetical protein
MPLKVQKIIKFLKNLFKQNQKRILLNIKSKQC